MNWIHRLLLVFFILLGITQSAQASIVTSVAQGSSVIINFDFSGQTPQPPYPNVSVDFLYDGIFGDGQTDNGSINFFSDLNGGGVGIATYSWSDSSTLWSFASPQFTDGKFSVVFSSIDGDMTISSATAAGSLITGQRVIITGSVGNSVPEPGSLALMGLALVGMASRRGFRKPSNPHSA